MQSNNKVVISSAGSGKTTRIVKEAISKQNNRSILLTYTVNNLNEIKKKFYESIGSIPENITVQTWFTFLLSECVRPYQSFVYDKHRIDSIYFINNRSSKFIPKNRPENYYITNTLIYSDKLSEFAIDCNFRSGGLVIKRLEEIYDYVFIDEVQDLAGYDLDLVELLLQSKINIMLVGDNRQATYSTNTSSKNEKYRGFNIYQLFKKWEIMGLCQIDALLDNYRCNQAICDFADDLFPEMPKSRSKNTEITNHDGIFVIPDDLLDQYISLYSPKVLRYNKITPSTYENVSNFGETKGQTFDRVLILPNKPIKEFLKSGDIQPVYKERAKLYVAITRAKYSVTFVYSGSCYDYRIIPVSIETLFQINR